MARVVGFVFVFAMFISFSNANKSDFAEDAKFGNQDEHGMLGENGDDQLFGAGEDFNSVHYSNDDPEASGDDDDLIPVGKPVLPKSRPKPVPETNTAETAEVTVEHTSFKPIEFNFEHKYPVLSGEQSTVHPDATSPDEPITEAEGEPEEESENELDQVEEKKEETVKLQSVKVNKEEEGELQLKSEKKPDAEKDDDEDDTEDHSDIIDNGHEYNETGDTFGETTKRRHSNELSNIAKIGIAIGCIVVFWMLLCPIVCIVCRRRDKKREKRAQEEYKLKNGVPPHQHHLVEELVLTELGQHEKHQSNGKQNDKQKLYGNDAHSAEELQHLSNQSNSSNHSSDVLTRKPKTFLGQAPLASEEALDTEV